MDENVDGRKNENDSGGGRKSKMEEKEEHEVKLAFHLSVTFHSNYISFHLFLTPTLELPTCF